MAKEDKLFTNFAKEIRNEHPQHTGSVWIWGALRDVKSYDKLACDAGFATRLFAKREEFLRELASSTDVLMMLILRDRLSRIVQRAIFAACERLDPLYILRVHGYVALEENTQRIGVVTEYSPLTDPFTPATQRVSEATRCALKRAAEDWKAANGQPEAANSQAAASISGS